MILLASDRGAVILTAHHVICDGWSLDVMIHDLCAFYSEKFQTQRRRSALPDSISIRAKRHPASLSQEFQRCGIIGTSSSPRAPSPGAPLTSPQGAARLQCPRVDHPFHRTLYWVFDPWRQSHGCSFFTALIGSLSILFGGSHGSGNLSSLCPAEQPSPVSRVSSPVRQPSSARGGVARGGIHQCFFKRLQGDLVQAQENSITPC